MREYTEIETITQLLTIMFFKILTSQIWLI